MVLLTVLNQLAQESGCQLAVAHFNHRLRGRSSDADERFVAQAAARLKLPLFSVGADVRSHAKQRGLSVEMAARELRHRFLARTARRWRCKSVALAHHADDQVELFFLRLLRGSGGRGLAGMKWRSPSPSDPRIQLVRPLLDVTRAEIEVFAREQRIRFRTDVSNGSSDFLRNRIRNELLPNLRRRFQPALNRNVLRLMEIVGSETAAVETLAADWLRHQRPGFDRLHVAVQRCILQTQLHERGLQTEFDLIEALRLAPATPVMVAPKVQAVRDQAGRLTVTTLKPASFRRDQKPVTLKGRAGEVDFGGLRIKWRTATQRGARLPAGRLQQEIFDADKVGERILLRHWRAGDRFQPIGMKAAVKLQDWFTNLKIPRTRRRGLVIATTAAGEIFWVQDLRIGERFKITTGTTRALHWRWQPG